MENMMMWMFVFMCAVCETVNGRRKYFNTSTLESLWGKKKTGERRNATLKLG